MSSYQVFIEMNKACFVMSLSSPQVKVGLS